MSRPLHPFKRPTLSLPSISHPLHLLLVPFYSSLSFILVEHIVDFLHSLGFAPSVDAVTARLRATSGSDALGIRGFIHMYNNGESASTTMNGRVLQSAMNLMTHAVTTPGG